MRVRPKRSGQAANEDRMNETKTRDFVESIWGGSILPALHEYIRIPNQSPAFDPDWRSNGSMDRAVDLIASWIDAQKLAAARLEIVRLENRTPLLLVEVEGDSNDTVLLYGHLDKQPPMHGWKEGLGPWRPVVRNDRLYGRGGADDGYAAFAAVAAIAAVQRQRLRLGRCVIIIEASEESGSPDLPHYIETLRDRIGTPQLVVCLDSGCGDYERLWITTSLRGLAGGTVHVSTLTEGVHSGAASGIVPSSFRVMRRLLERLEDAETGAIRPQELFARVPEERRGQNAVAAAVLGDTVFEEYPFQGACRPVLTDGEQLLLNRTWRPQLEVTGAAGLPPLDRAGNVLRPSTSLKLSLRLPPTTDARAANRTLKRLLEQNPPYGAQVTFDGEHGANGWNAPPTAAWLQQSAKQASLNYFGEEACYIGEGGTIPFMGMLGARFPGAQFMIIGVLGPASNAHGPNEFLHIPTAVKLTACVAHVLADHSKPTKTSDDQGGER
jgi:acetylornithine deacetylase/succinyl-diaminopimelate desuccinylase-like protein